MRKRDIILLVMGLLPFVIGVLSKNLLMDAILIGNSAGIEFAQTLIDVWGMVGTIYWIGVGLIMKKVVTDQSKGVMIAVVVPFILWIVFMAVNFTDIDVLRAIGNSINSISLSNSVIIGVAIESIPIYWTPSLLAAVSMSLVSILLLMGYKWPSKRI